MIDLHAHLLPGVDDGPTTWDEALEMVRMAAADGVTAMVATSHMMPGDAYPNTRERLLALTAELRERVRAEGIAMDIYPGAEVFMTTDTADLLARGELLTYCDANRYLLLEIPVTEMPTYAIQVIDDLRLQGVTPIIAHPERNLDIIQRPSLAQALVERGALLQVTASSLRAAPPVRAAARFLLSRGLAHFLASDVHGIYHRRPRVRGYLDLACEWVGKSCVERMVLHNPAAVLAGGPVEPRVGSHRRLGARGLFQSVVQKLTAR